MEQKNKYRLMVGVTSALATGMVITMAYLWNVAIHGDRARAHYKEVENIASQVQKCDKDHSDLRQETIIAWDYAFPATLDQARDRTKTIRLNCVQKYLKIEKKCAPIYRQLATKLPELERKIDQEHMYGKYPWKKLF